MNEGVIEVSADDYHAETFSDVPMLSSSIAKILLSKSPKHAHQAHPKLGGRPVEELEADEQKRKIMDRGTIAHAILLEGRSDLMVIVNPEDYRSKPNKANPDGAIPKGWTNNAIKERRDDIREQGKIAMLPNEANHVMRMVEEAKRFMREDCQEPILRDIFETGSPESTIIWQESGAWTKARLDLVTHDWRAVLDYKTTFNASPGAFGRQIASMDYHIQAELYSRGVERLKGRRPAWFFLAQEPLPPYSCSLHGLSNAYMDIAASSVTEAAQTWASCLASGKWPGYGGQTHYAEPAVWQLQKHMERGEIEDPFKDEYK